MSGTNSSAETAAKSRVKGWTTTASTPSDPRRAILAGRSRIIRVGLSGLKSTLGMRREGEHDRYAGAVPGRLHGALDHGPVTEVDAVEHPDGHVEGARRERHAVEAVELRGRAHRATLGTASVDGDQPFLDLGDGEGLDLVHRQGAWATLKRSVAVRRSAQRCAPQPSFAPRSWASVRT